MTEAEWLAASEREIYRLVAELSPRRQRLLAAAACRALGEWVNHPAAHSALEVVETFADTGKTKAALRRARQALVATRARLYYPPGSAGPGADRRGDLALFTVQVAATENAVFGALAEAMRALMAAEGLTEEAARRRLYPALRDVAGPPTAWLLPPGWRAGPVMSLAEGMYGSRDFAAMPVLADALEDAGCDDAGLLAHLRSPGPHFRGCWALDLILGKG